MRAAVMEGSLSEFDLPSVIQVVSLGRQYTGVELFDDRGASVGTLLLKSGKILAATKGSLSGLDAVLTLLRGHEQKRFSVYRTEPIADAPSPVGSVGEILFRALEHEKKGPARISVMEGSLAEFDLVSVLQVIGIGRQFTGVEVFEPSGKVIGKIEVKAGKVISATTGHLRGIDSMRRLVRSPPESRFLVYRTTEEPAEMPIGSLSALLMKLVEPEDDWDAAESNTKAHRTVLDSASRPSSQPPRRTTGAPPVASPPRPPPAPQGVDGVAARAPAAPAPSPRPAVAPQPAAVPAPSPPPPPAATRAKSEPAESQQGPFLGEAYTSSRGMVALPANEVPVVCVTSPKGGSGKTTVSINLSVALARRGKRVVLVDADQGGVLLALNAPPKSDIGACDVIAGRARVADVAIQTRLPGLRVVPSGEGSPASDAPGPGWAGLLDEAKADADIVLVDVGAGMTGIPAAVCASCTHALVVLAAEPASVRRLPDHMRRIEALGSPPPRLTGIVVNMLDYRAPASLEILKQLSGGPAARLAFDVPISRSPAFLEAVARGLPLSRGGRDDAPTVAWVFEMLASSILERLGIEAPAFDDAPLL